MRQALHHTRRRGARAGRALMAAGVLAMAAACGAAPTSGAGFSLPDGDAAAGQRHFVRLHCTDCHLVEGVDALRSADTPYLMDLPLGGEAARIATYGELVTSIINPSHRISSRFPEDEVSVDGESLMSNYNEVMTVAELIDIVAFLQAQYELSLDAPTEYAPYRYP